MHNRSGKKMGVVPVALEEEVTTPVLTISKVQPHEKSAAKNYRESRPAGIDFR